MNKKQRARANKAKKANRKPIVRAAEKFMKAAKNGTMTQQTLLEFDNSALSKRKRGRVVVVAKNKRGRKKKGAARGRCGNWKNMCEKSLFNINSCYDPRVANSTGNVSTAGIAYYVPSAFMEECGTQRKNRLTSDMYTFYKKAQAINSALV